MSPSHADSCTLPVILEREEQVDNVGVREAVVNLYFRLDLRARKAGLSEGPSFKSLNHPCPPAMSLPTLACAADRSSRRPAAACLSRSRESRNMTRSSLAV